MQLEEDGLSPTEPRRPVCTESLLHATATAAPLNLQGIQPLPFAQPLQGLPQMLSPESLDVHQSRERSPKAHAVPSGSPWHSAPPTTRTRKDKTWGGGGGSGGSPQVTTPLAASEVQFGVQVPDGEGAARLPLMVMLPRRCKTVQAHLGRPPCLVEMSTAQWPKQKIPFSAVAEKTGGPSQVTRLQTGLVLAYDLSPCRGKLPAH